MTEQRVATRRLRTTGDAPAGRHPKAAAGPWRGSQDREAGAPADPPSLDTLVTALVTAREAACLTQEALAERSGVSVRAIRNLETGHTARPRKQSLLLLAEALGVRPADVGLLPGRPSPVSLPRPARSTGPLPAELPPPPRHRLVGRRRHIDALRTHLTAPGHGDDGRPAVVVGPPGGGRTALLLAAAHGARDRFPDGQVFVDLHPAASAAPFTPDALVRRVLRSLGAVPPAGGPEEAAARLRDALSRRRVLVVLDNADSEAQIRPLLVDGGHSAVLAGARRELPALDSPFRRRIGVLTEPDALALLEDLVGATRIRAEPAAAAELVRFCARLPLALRIAGLWLSARPHRSLGDLAARLADGRDRVRFLRIGDLSLQASVAACHRVLPIAVRGSLRRLRTVGDGFTADGLVPHTAPGPAAAADLLDELVSLQLVHADGADAYGRVRYRVHDAVRQYVTHCLPGDG
ncbi:helix-turn-helix domain-containing protein [Streptomyces sp. NPDC005805]|uniref:helix-turn-helix domain-containing protein n=1 Tax=Streptomyces sp. NPDC005805 TaxID=3157068 RepID=UPI0033DAD106